MRRAWVLSHHGSPSNREAGMSNDAPLSASFDTTLKGVGNNTGIEIPAEVIETLGAGKRPPLLVNVNGYEYRTTAGVMGGVSMIPVSAAWRARTSARYTEKRTAITTAYTMVRRMTRSMSYSR